MRLIDADALLDFCANTTSKTIDCNDIARFPSVEPPKKVVAEIKVDTDELMERIKEEYGIEPTGGKGQG